MIDKNKVKAGDLLLYRIVKSSPLIGKLIGWFSVLTGNGGTYGRTYGHVGIVEAVSPNTITYLEQTFPKSKRSILDCNNEELELFRIPSATKAQLKEAISWGACNLGKWYNIRHILSLGFIKGYGCSDFIFNCFNETKTGIILNKKGDKDPVHSPNEIVDCGLVCCIDDGGHSKESETR